MVAFGERIAEAVSRAPIDLRNHYIAYASLKEVLDRPEQLRAGRHPGGSDFRGRRRD